LNEFFFDVYNLTQAKGTVNDFVANLKAHPTPRFQDKNKVFPGQRRKQHWPGEITRLV
jgi:hypothetical protein